MREDQGELSSSRRFDRRILLGVCFSGVALLAWFFWPSSEKETQVEQLGWGSINLSDQAAVIKAGLADTRKFPGKSDLSLAALQVQSGLGDAGALWELGRIYALGDSVIKDDEEAAKWFRLYARKIYDDLCVRCTSGDKEAMMELYRRFINGVGFPRDDKAACKWISLAARTGHFKQISEYASEFNNICDTRPNLSNPLFFETYCELLTQVAFKGGATEKVRLAEFHKENAEYFLKYKGLGRDYVDHFISERIEAYAWYNVAAAMRHPDAAVKRDALESVSEAGQKRSREIMAEIEKLKAGK